jgi:26S proteasome regulatory subunit N6
MATLETRLKRAKELSAKGGEDKWMEAEAELRKLTIGEDGKVSANKAAEIAKAREEAALALADLYASRGSADKLTMLLEDLRPLFAKVPKAKTAKIVRAIIDAVSRIPGTTELQLKLCREQAEWAREEKRTFLRQRIESRLASLLFATKDYQGALTLIGRLLSEVKRLDDKLLLVDIHLLESRVHHALRNIPKSKAALTAARSAANAIYVPPSAQAEIDCQSGTLHAEEKDYKTAYSYFYEGFEQYSSVDERSAGPVLKYMLLCKIMSGNADDVAGIVNTKAGLKFSNSGVDAMLAIAEAYKHRSLKEFQAALNKYTKDLTQDIIVHNHLKSLYDKMLEQNILRLIEPYSCVEIAHIAKLIDLPLPVVESKMSQMILDKTFCGTLDQGSGSLIIYDSPEIDKAYNSAIETFQTLENVVGTLMKRSTKIVA